MHNLAVLFFEGASPYGTPVTPRMNLNSNFGMATIPSIQLLRLEMLLHFLLGPEVVSFAKQNKLILSLYKFSRFCDSLIFYNMPVQL